MSASTTAPHRRLASPALLVDAKSNGRGRCFVSGAPPPLMPLGKSGRVFGRPMPWHQFVDGFLWPAVDETCQQVGKIGLRIDAIEFAGLDQRCQASPVLSTFVTAGEQTILPRKGD